MVLVYDPDYMKVVLARSGERETPIHMGENPPSWVHGPGSVKFQEGLTLQPSMPQLFQTFSQPTRQANANRICSE